MANSPAGITAFITNQGVDVVVANGEGGVSRATMPLDNLEAIVSNTKLVLEPAVFINRNGEEVDILAGTYGDISVKLFPYTGKGSGSTYYWSALGPKEKTPISMAALREAQAKPKAKPKRTRKPKTKPAPETEVDFNEEIPF